ncbi:MAG: condensation domain-containing protein [Luteolibacter sp.]
MPIAAIFDPMSPLDANPPSPTVADNGSGVLAFPASVAQQMFWYLELLQGTVTAFNVPLRFLLTGPLDISLFERALNAVVERHESLRTCFCEEDGELLQIVSPEIIVRMPVLDISHLPADRLNEEADRLGSIEAHRPFDLSKAPLLRAEILRLGPEHHIFHFTVHHALFDGMSMTIFTAELSEFYQAFFENRAPKVDPLAIQYGDYSVWQKEFLAGPKVKGQLEYWKKQLNGMKEVALPTEFPRPALKSWKGDITSILLPNELSEKLQTIAASKGGTLFHVHLAAFMMLLRRYSGDLDVAVGAPVAGRSGGDLEPLIGVFINTLILRSNLSGNPTFFDYLSQIREMSLESLENQELPFEHLVHELRPARDPSRNPLFQVNFNHHRSFTTTEHFGGVALTTIPSRSPGAIFDLHLFLVERDEGWRASLDFSTELFTRESANRMLGHLKTLMEDIAAHPDKHIEDFEILTAPEKSQLLHDWAETEEPYPRDATIGQLFLETANRHPEHTALVSGDRIFTYQQVHADATRIAGNLCNAGVKPGDIVAIAARPGPELIAGIVGIILAGGCCSALDPSSPTDLLASRLKESGASIVLIVSDDEVLIPKSWNGTIRTIEPVGSVGTAFDLPEIAIDAESPAHLLYTSGTTSPPKGVLLSHRGMTRLARCNGMVKFTPNDVLLQTSPISLDASLLEIWGALLNGARLVLLQDKPGLDDLATAIRNHKVTTLWLTSGLFQLMLDEQPDVLKAIHTLIVGGDVMSPSHARKALADLPDTKLFNGYGPTENSTLTTFHQVTHQDLDKVSIPIGKPVPNTRVYLLDDLLRPVPVGIPGELCTGGDGLAIGYLKTSEAFAGNFIEHPDFGRLLRTGDLCRRATDGSIEFIGRKGQQAAPREIKPELNLVKTSAPNADLTSSTEARLTAIWQDLLNLPDIGRDDDFFALGGHSLMTLRMFSRIHREFGKSLPLATLLKHPTIASLAPQIGPPHETLVPVAVAENARPVAKFLPKSNPPAKSNIITLTEGDGEKPLFCIHGGDGGVIFYRGLATLMPSEIPFHAIESLELNNSGVIVETSIEETATSYLRDILSLQQIGPFRLAGYSFGGVVAHEIACQLIEQGHKVEFLGMFDTDNPTAPIRNYSLSERLGVFWRRNNHVPFGARLGLVRERICEGVKTNRRIKAELHAAKTTGPAEAYSDMRRVQVREENWRAMQAYKPRPFAGQITLFKSTHVSDKYVRLEDYGWSSAAAGLEVVPVEGEHLALFASENVDNLAKVLTDALKATRHPES